MCVNIGFREADADWFVRFSFGLAQAKFNDLVRLAYGLQRVVGV